MDNPWEYSRNQRKHWINDGEFYGDRYFRQWEIHCCSESCGYIDPKKGYDLYHKGKKVAHGKTVKELKKIASEGDA